MDSKNLEQQSSDSMMDTTVSTMDEKTPHAFKSNDEFRKYL